MKGIVKQSFDWIVVVIVVVLQYCIWSARGGTFEQISSDLSTAHKFIYRDNQDLVYLERAMRVSSDAQSFTGQLFLSFLMLVILSLWIISDERIRKPQKSLLLISTLIFALMHALIHAII